MLIFTSTSSIVCLILLRNTAASPKSWTIMNYVTINRPSSQAEVIDYSVSMRTKKLIDGGFYKILITFLLIVDEQNYII